MKVLELVAQLQNANPNSEVRIKGSINHFAINACMVFNGGVLLASSELDNYIDDLEHWIVEVKE